MAVVAALVISGPAAHAQKSSPSPSPSAFASPSSTSSPAPSATTAASPSPSPSNSGSPSLQVTTRSSALLAQVGSIVRYTVIVANNGNAAADDVIVLDLVPAEVHVLSVDLLDEVEAVQIGSTGGKDDIVWNVGELKPGQSLELTWTGRATKAGDMRAANRATVTADGGLSASDDHDSFLAATAPAKTTNPTFDPIVKRKVIFRAPSEDASTGSGTLPFTGMNAWPYAGIGAGLIVLGLILVSAGRRRGGRRWGAVGVALLMMLTGCTSGSGDDEPPVVKGTRIERDDPADQQDDAPEQDAGESDDPFTEGDQDGNDGTENEDVGDDETAVAPPAPAPPAPPAPPVRDVRITTIELADLPISLLGSRDGDNDIGYQWDEGAGEFVTANSSTVYTPGQTIELLTEISDTGGGIQVHVRLRNIAERERVAVRGQIVHEVFGSGGRIAKLVSDPINVVLDPGGETGADFFFMLPSGNYSAGSSFQAD
jgi:uncharacterized repeat protein (TIGR01451 family)